MKRDQVGECLMNLDGELASWCDHYTSYVMFFCGLFKTKYAMYQRDQKCERLATTCYSLGNLIPSVPDVS